MTTYKATITVIKTTTTISAVFLYELEQKLEAHGVSRSGISVISQCMMITACKSVTIGDADKIVFAQKITA